MHQHGRIPFGAIGPLHGLPEQLFDTTGVA
jgi:hypothetical protein